MHIEVYGKDEKYQNQGGTECGVCLVAQNRDYCSMMEEVLLHPSFCNKGIYSMLALL